MSESSPKNSQSTPKALTNSLMLDFFRRAARSWTTVSPAGTVETFEAFLVVSHLEATRDCSLEPITTSEAHGLIPGSTMNSLRRHVSLMCEGPSDPERPVLLEKRHNSRIPMGWAIHLGPDGYEFWKALGMEL